MEYGGRRNELEGDVTRKNRQRDTRLLALEMKLGVGGGGHKARIMGSF